MKKSYTAPGNIIFLLVVSVLFFPLHTRAVPSEVFDPLLYTLCEKLLTSSKELKSLQKDVIQGISEIKSVTGGLETFTYSGLASYLHQGHTGIGLVDKGKDYFTQKHLRGASGDLQKWMKGLVGSDVMGESTHEVHQKIMDERDRLAKEMTMSGLVLSIQSGELLEKDYQQLQKLVQQGTQSVDLRSDLAMNNALLMLLVHEMIQLRLLFAKHLGVSATDALRQSPLLLNRAETKTSLAPQRDFPWGGLQ